MTENTPFFSVIIPTRNRSMLLKRCIAGVINQKYSSWELIIVDDGSCDETKEVVAQFLDARIHYYYQEHLERSDARNKGIDRSKGQYICFIDDDDQVTPDYLFDFYLFYQNNDCPLTILRTGFIKDFGNKRVPTTNYDEKKHQNPVNFAAYNMCGVWSLSIPRNFLKENKFPPQFPHWQDTHLILRLFMNYDFVQLNSHNYIYTIHENMGSLRATKDHDPIARATLNVAAIEDLFEIEKDRIFDYVPKNTLSFLKAQKYIEYANNVSFDNNKNSEILLQLSLSAGVFFKLWKNYLMYSKQKIFHF